MESDEALLDRLRAGDMGAFDRLYERHERPLFGFVRAMLRDDAEAEDVLHETFLAVLRERQAGGNVRSFRAWVYQVGRNLCLNRLRARPRAGRAVDAIAGENPAGTADSPEEELVLQQRAESLRRAVEALPPALAEVYRLRASGLSHEEAAAALGMPVGTVKSRVHEMVKRLRNEVS
jgi:RNA polymerase sigma-70 factor (ECF subfamily)